MRAPKSSTKVLTRSQKPPSTRTRTSTMMRLPVRTRRNQLKLAKSKIENIMNVKTYRPPTEELKFNYPLLLLTNKSAEANIYTTSNPNGTRGNRVVKVLRGFPPKPKMVKEYKKLKILGDIGLGPKVYRIGVWNPNGNNHPRVAIEQQRLHGDLEHLLLKVIPKLPATRQKKVKASLCSKLKKLLKKIWEAGLYHGDLHHGNIMYTLSENDFLRFYLVDVETVHTDKYSPQNWQLKEIQVSDTFKNRKTWMKGPIYEWMQGVCKFDKRTFNRSYSKLHQTPSEYNAMMKYIGMESYRRGNLVRSQSLRPVSALSNKQPGVNENYRSRLSLRPITPIINQ
jgi:tRNA A-37 threonylcarbamoyl transferase component Bud32